MARLQADVHRPLQALPRGLRQVVRQAASAATYAAPPPPSPPGSCHPHPWIGTLSYFTPSRYRAGIVSSELEARLGPGPVIVPISDLRQDAAGVLRQVVASPDPVFVTQRRWTVAVLLCRLDYDRLQRGHEILSRAVVSDLEIPLDEGLSLADILARGRERLDDERRAAAKERAATARRLDDEAREATLHEKPITLEERLTSCGFGHLVAPQSGDADDV